MEVVAPASLQTAVNTASTGETIACAGVFRENLKIGKAGIKLVPKDGATAAVFGRVWVAKTASNVTWDSVTINGRNPANLPSPTIDAPNCTFRGRPDKPLEVTNGNTAIAFNTTDYDGGRPDDFLLENFWIHHVGSMPAGNHDHGVYLANGRRAIVRNGLIHDCSDRAIQLYSDCHNALVENVTAAYCGQLLNIGGGEWGTPSSGNLVRRCIFAYPQGGPGGTYIVMSNGTLGFGNVVDDNVLWGPPSHPTYEAGMTVSRTRLVVPGFVDGPGRDFRLRADSPAVGYGPSWLQPGGQPAPADRAAILAEARAHMAKTTITYPTWLRRKQSGYYRDPAATEWAKTDALLDQLK